MKPANSVMSGFGTTVFEVMSQLAMEHGSINLGQGFPDGNGPPEVVDAAQRFLADRPNQYPPMMGVPELRQAVARHDKRFHGLEVDWQTEVIVTSGATEGLAACLFGLIEPGDEVVLIEPLYDSYLPIVRRAGGIARTIKLEAPDWRIDEDKLRAAFSNRTKLLLLNNPLNPVGKVFTRAELQLISDLVIEHDAVAVCDEVYEHIVYDDAPPFIPLIAMPGMRERTLRIGSAGKTFSLTGWKVGYVTAAPQLLRAVTKTHQFLVFTTPPNLQRAVAAGLDLGDDYYRRLAGDMQAKRDRLARGLSKVGFGVLPTQGTYFITADIRPLGFNGTDEDFCRYLTTEAKVTALPVSAFFGPGGPRDFARFCFCKYDEVLDNAVERLQKHFRA